MIKNIIMIFGPHAKPTFTYFQALSHDTAVLAYLEPGVCRHDFFHQVVHLTYVVLVLDRLTSQRERPGRRGNDMRIYVGGIRHSCKYCFL